jgi:O-antigen/teichoic acid export membrane protein
LSEITASKEIPPAAAAAVNEAPSTAGITTRVVKGSLWTLAGQVLPLLVSFVATPFVIRFLGAESYGVLILITLIPSYFVFADLGMSVASTRFGSEAYAKGQREKEAEVVRTAALIALSASSPAALGILIFSFPIVGLFNVPENLRAEASLALKFAAATFVLNILCGIFNTPQLTRLRMDLNTLVTTGFRMLGLVATPFVLYFGGGIAGAAFVLLASAALTLAGHFFISSRLLRELVRLSIDRNIIKPLLVFGGALAVSNVAGILLVNLEKAVLPRVASVESLAYYSVAFTLASMATLFSGAMTQSLLPAFSQLFAPEKKEEMNRLFARTLRINIIGLVPAVAFLFVVAEPFFTFWAGADFGRESAPLFYILLSGLFFNIIAYIPHASLVASGRTDMLAKIYWLELPPYILATVALTSFFGAAGAAIAWSLRVVVDALIFIWLSKNLVGISLKIFQGNGLFFALVSLALMLPIFIIGFINNYSIWLFISAPLCVFVYFVTIWRFFLEAEEKRWVNSKIHALIYR